MNKIRFTVFSVRNLTRGLLESSIASGSGIQLPFHQITARVYKAWDPLLAAVVPGLFLIDVRLLACSGNTLFAVALGFRLLDTVERDGSFKRERGAEESSFGSCAYRLMKTSS